MEDRGSGAGSAVHACADGLRAATEAAALAALDRADRGRGATAASAAARSRR